MITLAQSRNAIKMREQYKVRNMNITEATDHKEAKRVELYTMLHKAVSAAIREFSDTQLKNLVKEPYDSFAAEQPVALAA